MWNNRKRFFKAISYQVFICTLWLISTCLAFAVSSSVDVQQTVIYTGGGFSLPVDATPPEISDVDISDVGLRSAKIFWRTDEACQAELRYGLTSNMELGPIYDHPDSYEKSHEFALENLKAGSRYYLKITARSSRGVERSTIMYDFYTAPEILTVPNVGSPSVVQNGKKAVLNWRNPSDGNFSGVQINRRIGSPALRVNEGEKIFSGRTESFTDAGIADNTEYYYTVFSYDASGNFSYGATVSIKTNFSTSGNGGEGSGNEDSPVSGGGENNGRGSENAGGNETGTGVGTGDGNVADLSAAASWQDKKIILSWKCPHSEKECAVEIRRSVGSPADFPSKGELVYSGSGASFEDSNVKEGQTYFYTVFTKSGSGIYSSGAMAVSQLPSPIEGKPQSDVFFVDTTRGVLLAPDDKGNIHVLEGNTLGISCIALPPSESFKTVVAMIDNTTYLLNSSAEAQSHWTSLAVPEAGVHNLMISFVNADNKLVSYRHFFLNVVPKGKIFMMKNEGTAENLASRDKLLCLLGNIAGGNDRNCMEIQGIEGAKITVFAKNSDGKREVWNAGEFNQNNPSFSGSGGSFGFSVPNGEYEILIEKEGFDNKTLSLSVGNNIIAENVEINVKKYNIYVILLTSIAFVLIVVFVKIIYLNKKLIMKKK